MHVQREPVARLHAAQHGRGDRDGGRRLQVVADGAEHARRAERRRGSPSADRPRTRRSARAGSARRAHGSSSTRSSAPRRGSTPRHGQRVADRARRAGGPPGASREGVGRPAHGPGRDAHLLHVQRVAAEHRLLDHHGAVAVAGSGPSTSASFSSSTARAISWRQLRRVRPRAPPCARRRGPRRTARRRPATSRSAGRRARFHTASPGSTPVKLRSSARRTIAAVPLKSLAHRIGAGGAKSSSARSWLARRARAPTSLPSSTTVTSVMIESSRTHSRGVPAADRLDAGHGLARHLARTAPAGPRAAMAPKFVSHRLRGQQAVDELLDQVAVLLLAVGAVGAEGLVEVGRLQAAVLDRAVVEARPRSCPGRRAPRGTRCARRRRRPAAACRRCRPG